MISSFFKADDGHGNQSVLLRKQVPIRFDEPARSWLGGLPEMPADIVWPRNNDDNAPLQFAAQVCCADLPPGLWGGRGPRTGWLLVFVDVLRLEDESEGDKDGLVQVLHVDKLGPPREPPDDMSTIRHAMVDYIDCYEPGNIRPGVPKMWRRWPLDLIVQDVPPPPVDEDEDWDPLPVSEEELYGGPVLDDRIEHVTNAIGRPLTWRGFLYLLDGIIEHLGKDEEGKHVSALQKLPDWPSGWLETAIANASSTANEAETSHAEAQAWYDGAVSGLSDAARQAHIERIADMARWIPKYQEYLDDLVVFRTSGGEAALAADVGNLGAAHLAWIGKQLETVSRLRSEVLRQDLDGLISQQAWSTIAQTLKTTRTQFWRSDDFGKVLLRRTKTSLWESYCNRRLEMAIREDVLDLYTRGPSWQAAIPAALIPDLEPRLRRVGYDGEQHRMGGPGDVVQNYDNTSMGDMFFQLATDSALGWSWGDAGLLHIYIKPFDLKNARYKRTLAWIAGH